MSIIKIKIIQWIVFWENVHIRTKKHNLKSQKLFLSKNNNIVKYENCI